MKDIRIAIFAPVKRQISVLKMPMFRKATTASTKFKTSISLIKNRIIFSSIYGARVLRKGGWGIRDWGLVTRD